MSRVTVFVTTIGGSTLRSCLDLLRDQTVMETELVVLDRIAPYAAAKQAMVDQCTTEFFIQVGDDMLLYPRAVEELVALMDIFHEAVMGVAPLWDADLGMPIYGLKIWRHALVRQVPFVAHPDGDRHDRQRLQAAGFSFAKIARERERCLGEHGTTYTPEEAFTRWRRLWQRHRRAGAQAWIEQWPAELRARFVRSGSRRDLFAMLGAAIGASEALWPETFEPYDYRTPDVELVRLVAIFPPD